MIKSAIIKLVNGENLSKEEMKRTVLEIMEGNATPSQIAAFLIALRMKGETVEEITGAALAMREKALKVDVRSGVVIDREEINVDDETILDTCGTGGSGTNTFNISTTTAFVVAGCGVKVAKHGNRSASSRCGSADVLEALGVNLDLPPEKVAKAIKEIGIGFLYAPLYHGAMKHAAGPRREIGVRTIFNILGPLCNPAKANCQVLGVYEPRLVQIMAEVLKNLGTRRAFVVHGLDTLDEITVTGPTLVAELKDGKISLYQIRPEDFGIPVSPPQAISGGDAKENARYVREVLEGKKGARRDVVLLNASAALVCAGKARNFKEGIKLAEESIDSGRALKKLQNLIEFSKKA